MNPTSNSLTGNIGSTTTNALTGSNRVTETADRAHDAVDKAADKAAPMLERASAVAHQTIDRVANAATPAAQWATESGKQLATKSTEFAEQCSTLVRARPLATVAGALVLGYLLGKISR